ncbi:MAG TPA: hypothetical protein VK956_13555, partial [Verrucomicrobium sp.]|nr:hypothetical protein [Verrucomicrobium sp.]
VTSLAYSPKARLIAAGSYGQVRIIDPNGLATLRSLTGIAGKVNTVAFSADGTQVFAAAGDAGVNGIAYQWNVSDGALVRKFEGHNDALYALALAPDGRALATGSYDQKIRVWDLSTGAEVRVLTGHNGGVFGLAFRPDGKILASASADRTVKLWEVATGRRLDTFSQPLKEQWAVAFSPDGQLLAAGGTDNRLRVWQVSTDGVEGSNQLLATRFAHEGALLSVVFSPDGRQIVTTAADRSAKIWSGADFAGVQAMEKQSDWAPAVAALGEDKVLLGRLDGTFGVYELATGKPVVAAPVAKASKKTAAPDTKPVLTRIEPRGVQSGATTRLKVTGKNLSGLKSAIFSQAGLKATIVLVNPEGTVGELDVVTESTVPRSQVDLALATPTGETARLKVNVDYLPQVVGGSEIASADLKLPVNVWGTLRQTGQVDTWKFAARKGETVVFDLAAKRLESKAGSPRLEIVNGKGKLLATNNGLDSGSDPFIAFQAPEDGEYKVLVREITLSGSDDHVYRLTAGVLPYV